MVFPGVSAVTEPEESPMVAIAGVPELQVPPAGASLKVDMLPWQMVVLPVITDGRTLTVIVAFAVHPNVVV